MRVSIVEEGERPRRFVGKPIETWRDAREDATILSCDGFRLGSIPTVSLVRSEGFVEISIDWKAIAMAITA